MTFAEELEIQDEGHGLKRTLKDLFSGAVGGVAQVLIGMFCISYSCVVLETGKGGRKALE
jgi:hypothetical protein